MRPTFFEKSDYIMQRKCVRASVRPKPMRPCVRASDDASEFRVSGCEKTSIPDFPGFLPISADQLRFFPGILVDQLLITVFALLFECFGAPFEP